MKLKIISVIGFAIALIIITLIVSCESDEKLEFDRYYSSGSIIYQTKCQNCHGSNGEGLQALMPPLTDSVYLRTNKKKLACSVKYGLKGKITINNKSFEGEMPQNDLAPIEIAEVLTYVTNSFGNKATTITSQEVDGELGKCE